MKRNLIIGIVALGVLAVAGSLLLAETISGTHGVLAAADDALTLVDMLA